MLSTQCVRCGFIWDVVNTRKIPSHCQSCRAQPIRSLMTENGKCIIWHGYFDVDQVTPVDEDGSPILPGIRSCGNKDCVNKAHVRKEAE